MKFIKMDYNNNEIRKNDWISQYDKNKAQYAEDSYKIELILILPFTLETMSTFLSLYVLEWFILCYFYLLGIFNLYSFDKVNLDEFVLINEFSLI